MSAYPPEGTVRVLMTPEAMEGMFLRDHLGRRLTVDWGEPNEFGDHTPTISVSLGDPAAQDMEDGRALRELRDALPTFMDDEGMERRADMTVQGPWWTHPDSAWDVSVSLWDEVAHATGATIAEAADACRAALEARNR